MDCTVKAPDAVRLIAAGLVMLTLPLAAIVTEAPPETLTVTVCPAAAVTAIAPAPVKVTLEPLEWARATGNAAGGVVHRWDA